MTDGRCCQTLPFSNFCSFSHTVFQRLRFRHAGVIISSNTIDTIHARKAIATACPSTERFNNVRNLCLQIKQH